MYPAVFLDRDNTIIHNDGDLGDPEQVRLIQGAASAIASLCGLGYRVIVVTNQGGVARGKYKEADVDAVHDRLAALVTDAANGARIHGFYFCPYHPKSNLKQYKKDHPDRKPHPGMLLRAAEDHRLDLSQSWMVGDQLRDIQAGAAAKVRTLLVGGRARAGEFDPGEPEAEPDFEAANLTEAVRIIAQQRKPDVVEQIERAEQGGKRWDAAAVARIQQQPARPKPAVEPPEDGASDGSDAARAEAFRPWNAPPAHEDEEAPAQRRRWFRRESGESEAPSTAKPAAANAETPAVPTEPPPGDEPPAVEAPRSAEEPAAGSDRVLRQILQELRQQRGGVGDFNATSLGAVVLQMIALICLAGALFMPADDELALMFRWLGSAVVFQLATIALLLFGRAR